MAQHSTAQHPRQKCLGLLALLALFSGCEIAADEGVSAGAVVYDHAHGVFVTEDGIPISVDTSVIRRTQAHFIRELGAEPVSSAGEADAILRAAERIEQLLGVAQESSATQRMQRLNGALRGLYLEVLLRDTSGSGASSDFVPLLSTTAGGAEYIANCKAHGVPVPGTIFKEAEGWVNHGLLDSFFDIFAPPVESELWTWESTDPEDPDGMCMALPRWTEDGSAALGVICLGRRTSKACFFDNVFGESYSRGEVIPILALNGGDDLPDGTQNRCTDCHRGENPFVVHPEQTPFVKIAAAGISLDSDAWHDPIVSPIWIQNPGPIALAPAATGDVECTSCHRRGGQAGQFPEVWYDPAGDLNGYCDMILREAAFTSAPGNIRTMPPTYATAGSYSSQTVELITRCASSGEPYDGSTIPGPGIADDPTVLSAVRIYPVYECANTVTVSGAGLGRTVELYRNDNAGSGDVLVGTRVVRDPEHITFELSLLALPPAVLGHTFTAYQTEGSVNSAPASITVRKYSDDYPGGMPQPLIVPALTHVCASTVGVQHIPGATITVRRNGLNPTTTAGSGRGYTVAHADAAFGFGDFVYVSQELCGPPKNSETLDVTDPEPDIPELRFEPPLLYEQQEILTLSSIVPGAEVEFESSLVSGSPLASVDSWPFDYLPNYDLAATLGRGFQQGEVIQVAQNVCDNGPPFESPPVLKCELLPAARIETPIGGQERVHVTERVPGAIIRIAGLTEIGDGGGSRINLTRPLVTGEQIFVMQRLGTCDADSYFSVQVQ